jgi:hypothetical protein
LPVASDSSHGEAVNLGCLSALGFLAGAWPPVRDRRPADGKAVQPGEAQAITFTTVLHGPQNARSSARAYGAVGRL